MARRKGETTARDNERRYPHHVAVLVPPGGLGARLLEMHAWCVARSLPVASGTSFRRDDRDHMVWCFADADAASAFAAAFGCDVVEK